jgi:hypothetical protein
MEASMTCRQLAKRNDTVRDPTAFLAVLVCAALAQAPAQAAEADAKRLLKAMSDYMAAQKALSFDFDSSLDIVSTQQQKLTLAATGSVVLNRPVGPPDALAEPVAAFHRQQHDQQDDGEQGPQRQDIQGFLALHAHLRSNPVSILRMA